MVERLVEPTSGFLRLDRHRRQCVLVAHRKDAALPWIAERLWQTFVHRETGAACLDSKEAVEVEEETVMLPQVEEQAYSALAATPNINRHAHLACLGYSDPPDPRQRYRLDHLAWTTYSGTDHSHRPLQMTVLSAVVAEVERPLACLSTLDWFSEADWVAEAEQAEAHLP